GGPGRLELVWGERGAWLGGMQRIGAALARPRAEPAGAPAPADPGAAAEIERIEAAWPRLRGSGAAAGLRRLGARGPERARGLRARPWAGLGTQARARLLPELGEGLSGAD
ncbi:MAG: DUF5691 domain-containing protein, partial [Pseudoclavibacter sp.]|nr:DUF5691 domain-containing protein [Pseudoclavibacter sp.]